MGSLPRYTGLNDFYPIVLKTHPGISSNSLLIPNAIPHLLPSESHSFVKHEAQLFVYGYLVLRRVLQCQKFVYSRNRHSLRNRMGAKDHYICQRRIPRCSLLSISKSPWSPRQDGTTCGVVPQDPIPIRK